ncbi:MAG: apolipoprotein N-acyltransferase [Bryobacterales bacterium]|nr:apolipoprotein N-acyltransferase [Bryobacterales bacterium]
MNFPLAAATGLLLVLIFPRFNLVWLAPAALAPLLFAVAREPRPLRRFLLGGVSGVVFWFGVCYWIQFVLAVHGGLGETAGWAVFLLFCLAKALHLGVFAWLAGKIVRTALAPPAIAALWVAIEATHGSLGFAWLSLGNAGLEMNLPMRLAPHTGVHGLSFIFAAMSALLALALLRESRRRLLWLCGLPLLILLPPLPQPDAGRAAVVVVQPNLSESGPWNADSVRQATRRLAYLSMTTALAAEGPKPDLIVWPEMPAPLYYDTDPGFREATATLARVTRAPVLTGTVAHLPDGGVTNSAVLVSEAGDPLSRYDKIHLVPFGEFVPWPLGFATKISTETGDFRAGENLVVSSIGGHRIAAFICYESVFPGFVRRFALNGAEVLFNLSNDGYFGRSAARDQHLSIVRMRAAENRRWILRPTNNGITAAVDPAGRISEALAVEREAAAVMRFSYIRETTLYTRFGDWFPALCALISAAALVWSAIPKYSPEV